MGAMKFHPIVSNVIDGYDKSKFAFAPNLIVVHHTGTGGKLLKTMDAAKRLAMHNSIARYLGAADKVYVSAHFQIGYEGLITQIVDPRIFKAFHAGKSQWWNNRTRRVEAGCNSFSVGIELLGDGNVEPYAPAQIESLKMLILTLEKEIPTLSRNRVVGHQDIAPKRKVDPGKFFPWKELESKLSARFHRTNWGIPVPA